MRYHTVPYGMIMQSLRDIFTHVGCLCGVYDTIRYAMLCYTTMIITIIIIISASIRCGALGFWAVVHLLVYLCGHKVVGYVHIYILNAIYKQ